MGLSRRYVTRRRVSPRTGLLLPPRLAEPQTTEPLPRVSGHRPLAMLRRVSSLGLRSPRRWVHRMSAGDQGPPYPYDPAARIGAPPPCLGNRASGRTVVLPSRKRAALSPVLRRCGSGLPPL